MTRKYLETDRINCVELFRKGKKPPEIAQQLGVNRNFVYATLKAAGISAALAPKWKQLPVAECVALFNSGIGARGVADRFGVSPHTVVEMLKAHGITPRNRSQQQQARMDNTTAEQRAAIVQKANAAARGREVPADVLIEQARSRFANGTTRTSYLEETFDKLMRERGHVGVRQFPIEQYNADFLFGNVVVEIFGGQWHWTGKHFARAPRRIKTILGLGFHLVIIAARSAGVSAETANHTISLLQEFGRDESTLRQYRMIRSNGEVLIASSSDADNFTIEWPFGNERDPTTGRYSTVR